MIVVIIKEVLSACGYSITKNIPFKIGIASKPMNPRYSKCLTLTSVRGYFPEMRYVNPKSFKRWIRNRSVKLYSSLEEFEN